MTTAEAVILGIVEGLTEFLPVSSTGHMILAEALLKMQKSNLTNVFIVNIQFGAILAVLVMYWRRFLQTIDLYYKLAVAFIPAAVLGLLLNKIIDNLLSSVTTVAISLVVGGVVLIFVDKIFKQQIDDAAHDEDTVLVKGVNDFGVEVTEEKLVEFNVTWRQAFIIGCYQTLAMIPGVSRSAVPIIGGLTQKFNIKRAAEFSFFLAVPTMAAASGYKLLKLIVDPKAASMLSDNLLTLLIGNIVAFLVAMAAIKFFINF